MDNMVNDGMPAWESLAKFRTIALDRQVSNARVQDFIQLFIEGGFSQNAKTMMVLDEMREEQTGLSFTPLAISWEAGIRKNAARLGLDPSAIVKDLETLGMWLVLVVLDGAHRVVAWFTIGEDKELLKKYNDKRAIDGKPVWAPDQLIKAMKVLRANFTFEQALALSVVQNKTEENVRLNLSERLSRFLLPKSMRIGAERQSDKHYNKLVEMMTGLKRRREEPIGWRTALHFLQCLESIMPHNLPQPPPKSKYLLTLHVLTRVFVHYPMPEGGSESVLEAQMQLLACLWWRSINNLQCLVDDNGLVHFQLQVDGGMVKWWWENTISLHMPLALQATEWSKNVGLIVAKASALCERSSERALLPLVELDSNPLQPLPRLNEPGADELRARSAEAAELSELRDFMLSLNQDGLNFDPSQPIQLLTEQSADLESTRNQRDALREQKSNNDQNVESIRKQLSETIQEYDALQQRMRLLPAPIVPELHGVANQWRTLQNHKELPDPNRNAEDDDIEDTAPPTHSPLTNGPAGGEHETIPAADAGPGPTASKPNSHPDAADKTPDSDNTPDSEVDVGIDEAPAKPDDDDHRLGEENTTTRRSARLQPIAKSKDQVGDEGNHASESPAKFEPTPTTQHRAVKPHVQPRRSHRNRIAGTIDLVESDSSTEEPSSSSSESEEEEDTLTVTAIKQKTMLINKQPKKYPPSKKRARSATPTTMPDGVLVASIHAKTPKRSAHSSSLVSEDECKVMSANVRAIIDPEEKSLRWSMAKRVVVEPLVFFLILDATDPPNTAARLAYQTPINGVVVLFMDDFVSPALVGFGLIRHKWLMLDRFSTVQTTPGQTHVVMRHVVVYQRVQELGNVRQPKKGGSFHLGLPAPRGPAVC